MRSGASSVPRRSRTWRSSSPATSPPRSRARRSWPTAGSPAGSGSRGCRPTAASGNPAPVSREPGEAGIRGPHMAIAPRMVTAASPAKATLRALLSQHATRLGLTAYSWRALSWLLYEKCLLLTMPLRDRLVHELEVLAHDFGQPDPAGVLIDLPLTQADLAELVVGSRAKVSRCVADLRRAGKLEVSGRRLILTRRFARH